MFSVAIIIEEKLIPARAIRTGQEELELPAGQWVSYRYGTPENPVDSLLIQVPVGKKWNVTMNVYIEELDA